MKRIVNPVKEVPVEVMNKPIIPTLKTALVGENVFHPGEIKEREKDEAERAGIRERVGLTYERLCQTVKEGLVAEMVILGSDGKEVNRVPANSERAKFLQAAVDLLGAKKADVGAQRCPSILIILPNGKQLH
jgi:hypothetical protein